MLQYCTETIGKLQIEWLGAGTSVSDFFGWIFFPFKSAWIFACAFQFGSKTFSWFFLAEMLLLCFVVFIVHASIFWPCFSQKQNANQPKKFWGMYYYLIEKQMQKFWRKKIHLKKSLTSVLHQAIQYLLFLQLVNLPGSWSSLKPLICSLHVHNLTVE